MCLEEKAFASMVVTSCSEVFANEASVRAPPPYTVTKFACSAKSSPNLTQHLSTVLGAFTQMVRGCGGWLITAGLEGASFF